MTTLNDRALTPARTIRLAPADRPWAHAGTVASVFGPLQPIDPAAMVTAIRTLAAIGPQTRVGLVRADERSWSYDPAGLDALAQQMVTPVQASDEAGMTALIEREFRAGEADGADVLPLRFLVAENWVAMINQHLIGDGHQVMLILAAVLSLAHGGPDTPPPAWTAEQPLAHPLRTALWNTFGRHPGRVRAVLADRPAAAASAAGEQVPWTPQPAVVSARTTTAARRDLVRWGAEHAAGASLAALSIATLRAGLEGAGIDLDPATAVALNARRYLPRGAVVPGNFAARFVVAPQDPGSPEQLSVAIERAGDSGRPLAGLAASALAGRKPGAAPPPPTTAPAPGPAQLGFSYFGRPMHIERLPWSVPAEQRRFVGHVDPGGADHLGCVTFLIGGGVQFSLSYHANRHEPAALRAALDAVTADPVGVLAGRRG